MKIFDLCGFWFGNVIRVYFNDTDHLTIYTKERSPKNNCGVNVKFVDGNYHAYYNSVELEIFMVYHNERIQ